MTKCIKRKELNTPELEAVYVDGTGNMPEYFREY